jgi:hypothetical protein
VRYVEKLLDTCCYLPVAVDKPRPSSASSLGGLLGLCETVIYQYPDLLCIQVFRNTNSRFSGQGRCNDRSTTTRLHGHSLRTVRTISHHVNMVSFAIAIIEQRWCEGSNYCKRIVNGWACVNAKYLGVRLGEEREDFDEEFTDE